MERKDTLKCGGKLYSVNLKTLNVTTCDLDTINQVSDCTTTYENFNLNSELKKISLDKLPFERNGFMYFKTKDEAFDFVKFQVGM